MYYYTYLLINMSTEMFYIGKRQCKCLPTDDNLYFGSSKYVPIKECDKIILSVFTTSQEAVEHEIYLHAQYDVKASPQFYNRSNQTSRKFDTTGFRFSLTPEQRAKLSASSKGTPKTLTALQRQQQKVHLSKYRTPELRKKAAETLKANGKSKGVKNAGFKPWYLSTRTVTYLFTNITKAEQAIVDGFKSRKHYVDIQRKLPPEGIGHSLYGYITAMGDLPSQYKI